MVIVYWCPSLITLSRILAGESRRIPGSSRPDSDDLRERRLRMNIRKRIFVISACLAATLGFVVFTVTMKAAADDITHRGDGQHLPDPVKAQLVELNGRPHSFPPLTAFSEAATPSQLFQYYLLDTKNFQPNVFTTTIPGINDGVAPTATGPNGDLPTVAAV